MLIQDHHLMNINVSLNSYNNRGMGLIKISVEQSGFILTTLSGQDYRTSFTLFGVYKVYESKADSKKLIGYFKKEDKEPSAEEIRAKIMKLCGPLRRKRRS